MQLALPANQIGALGNPTVAGGDFTLTDSVALAVSGVVQATKSGALISISDTAPSPGTAISITGQLLAGAHPTALGVLDGKLELSTANAGADVR